MNSQWYSTCNLKPQEEINHKIYERNIPSKNLQPYLDVRPVMTKYSYFPVVDPRRKITTNLNIMPTYNVNNTFNPGNATAPWSGFASNVNVESELRNQIYALQKSSQCVYVPESKSDLYEFSFVPTNKVDQPHSYLFKNETFNEFNPNEFSEDVGYAMFNNSTRTQIKDLTPQSLPSLKNNQNNQNNQK
jgi:hypothetical protein